MGFQKTKVDSKLGFEIQRHLEELGIHTPVDKEFLYREVKEKIAIIESHITEIWKTLGMDLTDDSLVETPNRIAKMLVLEDYWGLLPENFPKNTLIEDKMRVDEMVMSGALTVNSKCEHHGVHMLGHAYIAYIAHGKVIGLSKLARVVEYFSHRPQVQERLTSQIYHALSYLLKTDDVAVVIRATHFCMTTRGVEDKDAWTQTSKLGGSFKNDGVTRSEFMSSLPPSAR